LKRYSPSTIYQPPSSHLNQPSPPNDHENQQNDEDQEEMNLPPSHDQPSPSLMSHLSSSPVKQSSIVLLMGYLR